MSQKPAPPSRTAEQFVLRMPDGMRARIAAVAKENNRSMNAEIVARLDTSFSNQGQSAAAGALIDALVDVEMDRQEAILSTLALANALKFAIGCVLHHDDPQDPNVQREMRKLQALADKFDTSEDAIREFRRERDEKIERVANEIRDRIKKSRPTPRLDLDEIDPAPTSTAPSEPKVTAPARRLRLGRETKP